MAVITYPRGTTFPLTFNYTPLSGMANGATALFTVKPTQYDVTSNDSTAVFQKRVALTNNTGQDPILPTDVSDTNLPGTYYYDYKVIDSTGEVFLITTDKFKLTASPTNVTS